MTDENRHYYQRYRNYLAYYKKLQNEKKHKLNNKNNNNSNKMEISDNDDDIIIQSNKNNNNNNNTNNNDEDNDSDTIEEKAEYIELSIHLKEMCDEERAFYLLFCEEWLLERMQLIGDATQFASFFYIMVMHQIKCKVETNIWLKKNYQSMVSFQYWTAYTKPYRLIYDKSMNQRNNFKLIRKTARNNEKLLELFQQSLRDTKPDEEDPETTRQQIMNNHYIGTRLSMFKVKSVIDRKGDLPLVPGNFSVCELQRLKQLKQDLFEIQLNDGCVNEFYAKYGLNALFNDNIVLRWMMNDILAVLLSDTTTRKKMIKNRVCRYLSQTDANNDIGDLPASQFLEEIKKIHSSDESIITACNFFTTTLIDKTKDRVRAITNDGKNMIIGIMLQSLMNQLCERMKHAAGLNQSKQIQNLFGLIIDVIQLRPTNLISGDFVRTFDQFANGIENNLVLEKYGKFVKYLDQKIKGKIHRAWGGTIFVEECKENYKIEECDISIDTAYEERNNQFFKACATLMIEQGFVPLFCWTLSHIDVENPCWVQHHTFWYKIISTYIRLLYVWICEFGKMALATLQQLQNRMDNLYDIFDSTLPQHYSVHHQRIVETCSIIISATTEISELLNNTAVVLLDDLEKTLLKHDYLVNKKNKQLTLNQKLIQRRQATLILDLRSTTAWDDLLNVELLNFYFEFSQSQPHCVDTC